jgi:tyrosinase
MIVRRSLRELWNEYQSGAEKPLEDLVRAWKMIQELPPEHENSFFRIGGYHGEPFELRTAVDELDETNRYAYWGGYCNHGNVLFPTWHRMYVKRLESALQSQVPGVAMPYWDETSKETIANGVPEILTNEFFELDGKQIKNPLRSFTLPQEIQDEYWADNTGSIKQPYHKPKGYETVRYPLSGLVGTPEVKAATEARNANFPDPILNDGFLNKNVVQWIQYRRPTSKDPTPKGPGIKDNFEQCLLAPNYTVFSNTTSAAAWNRAAKDNAVALETPHNDIHLAIGGFTLGETEFGLISGANGDMGENNTAGLDPIFFFHHCNIDRVFWLWQKRNGFEEDLEIIAQYPGTNSNDMQGPTRGIAPGTELTLDSPLYPFCRSDGTSVTSKDVINIHNLGYEYSEGSLESLPALSSRSDQLDGHVEVAGINRAAVQGSFLIQLWADEPNGDTQYLGHYSVLSRYNVIQCANCLAHLEVSAHFKLPAVHPQHLDNVSYRVEVTARGKGPDKEPTINAYYVGED